MSHAWAEHTHRRFRYQQGGQRTADVGVLIGSVRVYLHHTFYVSNEYY